MPNWKIFFLSWRAIAKFNCLGLKKIQKKKKKFWIIPGVGGELIRNVIDE